MWLHIWTDGEFQQRDGHCMKGSKRLCKNQNTISKINSFNGLISRLDTAKCVIIKFKDK